MAGDTEFSVQTILNRVFDEGNNRLEVLPKLKNNEYLVGRNSADDANLDIIKVNASDETELGQSPIVLPSGATVKTGSGDITLSPAGDLVLNPGSGLAYLSGGNGLVVGHNAKITTAEPGELQLLGTTEAGSKGIIGRFTNNSSSPTLDFVKSRNTDIGNTFTKLNSGDNAGDIVWRIDDGTDYNSIAAMIRAQVDAATGTNDSPGRLVMSTTAAGSKSPTEAARLNSKQQFIIGDGTITSHSDADVKLVLDGIFVGNTEQSADPTLVASSWALFQSDGTGTGAEGDVIVGADNAAGGGDVFAILFDYSAGNVSSARYKHNIAALTDPYRILDIHAQEWDTHMGIHEWGFVAEDVYRILGRGGTPLSPITAEWWTPEYGERYGYEIGDKAPNQIHLGGIVGAHHEILRDHQEKLERLQGFMAHTENGWLRERFMKLVEQDPDFRAWARERILS